MYLVNLQLATKTHSNEMENGTAKNEEDYNRLDFEDPKTSINTLFKCKNVNSEFWRL